jgi:hypothetical protein
MRLLHGVASQIAEPGHVDLAAARGAGGSPACLAGGHRHLGRARAWQEEDAFGCRHRCVWKRSPQGETTASTGPRISHPVTAEILRPIPFTIRVRESTEKPNFPQKKTGPQDPVAA